VALIQVGGVPSADASFLMDGADHRSCSGEVIIENGLDVDQMILPGGKSVTALQYP
jgi:hypothetical protein